MPNSTKPYDYKANNSYSPSAKDREAINLLYDRMYRMQYLRNRRWRLFNNRSLLRYMDDSWKRWNGYIPPKDDTLLDWQANYFNNFTRNVVVSFLSMLATKPPSYKVRARDDENRMDGKRADIAELFLRSADQQDAMWYKTLMIGLETVTKGTSIVKVYPKRVKRKIKEITKFNPLTGEVSFVEKEMLLENDVVREVVPLEEFYIANVWQPELQKQPDIARKYRVRYNEAEWVFSKYRNWKAVQPGSYFIVSSFEQMPYFKERDYADIDYDIVEIVEYENRTLDRKIIAANGVVLYDGPLPYHHKMYDYAKGIYEPIMSDFFWGKSLPDKIASDQDIINTLWNMMVDQGFLTVYKPVLTDDEDETDDAANSIHVPGLVKKVNNKDAYRVLNEFTGPDQAHFQLLNTALKFANDNAGPISGGARLTTPAGGAVSANQALLAQEQARQVLGLNARFLEKLYVDIAELTLKEQLQFYALDARLKEYSGEQEKGAKLFQRIIRVNDAELSDGSRGTREIRVVPQKNLPTQDELRIEQRVMDMQGRPTEITAITPDYIRNIQFDIEIVPDSLFQQTRSIDRALGMEYVQGRLSLFPQLSNVAELARYWDSLFDQDSELMGIEGQPVSAGAQAAPGGRGQAAPPGMSPPGQGDGPPISAQIAGLARPLSLRALTNET